MAKKVIVYSTPTCMYCNMAKDFFKDNDISFTEYNVGSDLDKRREMVEKSNQMGVPVIVVDGEVIVGFDKNRLSELLEIDE